MPENLKTFVMNVLNDRNIKFDFGSNALLSNANLLKFYWKHF